MASAWQVKLDAEARPMSRCLDCSEMEGIGQEMDRGEGAGCLRQNRKSEFQKGGVWDRQEPVDACHAPGVWVGRSQGGVPTGG